MSDSDARKVLIAAFPLHGSRYTEWRTHVPTVAELQGVQAIGRFEGGYGGGWKGQGAGSNNWGAIQCGHYAPCKQGCFEYGDSDAKGKKYRGCFRKYATPVEGAAALIRQLYRRQGVPEALKLGDATLVAERMRASGYFEAPADGYASAIERNAKEIAGSLSEQHLVRRGGGAVQPTQPQQPNQPFPGIPFPAPGPTQPGSPSFPLPLPEGPGPAVPGTPAPRVPGIPGSPTPASRQPVAASSSGAGLAIGALVFGGVAAVWWRRRSP